MLSRRKLLSTVAVGGAVALAGCTSAQVQQAQATWAATVDAIQAAVARYAQYIPSVESIIAQAAAVAGPAYATIVQVGTGIFNTIVNTLINVVGALTPAVSSRLRAKLAATTPAAPVYIGTINNPQGAVTVTGYRV